MQFGDEFEYDFTTYGQDASVAYQNIGIIICKVNSTYYGCDDSDRFIYTRGATSGTISVAVGDLYNDETGEEGDTIYAYVHPYWCPTCTAVSYTHLTLPTKA